MRREDRDGIVVYGSYGKPLLVFPAERGNRFEWENTGMIGAARAADRGGTAQGLLRRRVGREHLVGRLAPGRGARPAPRRVRAVAPLARRPVDPPRLQRADRDRRRRRLDGRLPRRQLRAPPRRPLPARRLPLRHVRPDSRRLGRARRRRRTSTTRWRTSRTCTASTSTGCARRSTWCSSSAAAPWEDSTGALESTAAVRVAARREGNPARAGRLGRGLAARLARLATPDRSSSAATCLTT